MKPQVEEVTGEKLLQLARQHVNDKIYGTYCRSKSFKDFAKVCIMTMTSSALYNVNQSFDYFFILTGQGGKKFRVQFRIDSKVEELPEESPSKS